MAFIKNNGMKNLGRGPKFKNLDDYIKKFGEELGKVKFNICVERRDKRKSRNEANRSNIKKIFTEKDIEKGDAIKCEECGLILQRIQWTHFINCPGEIDSIDSYKKKYNNVILVAPNLAKKCVVTVESLTALYGKKEGLERFEKYCNKQSETNTFEYKMKKYGWTQEQFDEYNKSRAVTLEHLIQRHGEEKGNKIWLNYCEQQGYTNKLEYFIEREGSYEKGLSVYNEICKEKGKASKSGTNNSCVSIIEKEFIDNFENIINEKIEYCYKTNQYWLWSEFTNSYMFYDMVDTKRKKVIEFNGDFWHANPELYEKNDGIFSKTAENIWEYDKRKKQEMADRGYDVRIVWEGEYKKNKEKVLNELKGWWNDGK